MKSKVIGIRIPVVEYANFLLEAESKDTNIDNLVKSKFRGFKKASEKCKELEAELAKIKIELAAKPKEVVKEVLKVQKVPKTVTKEVIKVVKDNDEINRLNKLIEKCEAKNKKLKADYDKLYDDSLIVANKHNKLFTRLKEANAYLKKNTGGIFTDVKKF